MNTKIDESAVSFWDFFPYILSFIIIIGTIFFAQTLEKNREKQNYVYFKTLVSDTQESLLNRYQLYEQSLRGGHGLFKASTNVTREEWKEYVESLHIEKNLPGINGIGFIDYVAKGQLKNYLDLVHETDKKDFINHPNTNFSDKFVIRYISPEANNMSAIGLDIGFEKHRRQAAEKSRENNLPALTNKIQLVQDEEKLPGFLLLIPFINKDNIFKGWVYAPFIGRNFLQDLSKVNKDQINFSVYDETSVNEKSLIYRNYSKQNLNNASSDYKITSHIEIAGMPWTITWQNNDNFSPPNTPHYSISILITGFLIATLSYYLIHILTKNRKRISQQVSLRTKELQKSKKEIETIKQFQDIIFSNIPDLLFVKDSQYKIVQANDAFLSLYPENIRSDIIGTTTVEKYNKEEAEEFLKNDRLALDEGYAETEEKILFPNGETKILFTKKTRFQDAMGEYFIIGLARDITEIKSVQNNLIAANDELEEFAYRTSHDLRSPLLSSISLLNMAKGSIKDNDLNTVDTAVDHTLSSLKKLEVLIQDILCLTQAKNEKEKATSINVIEIIEDSLLKFAYMDDFDKVSISKKINHRSNVSTQKSRLILIIENLISNAIKYQDPEIDSAHIIIKTYEKKDNFIFELEDNGLGIPEDQRENLFTMFKRFHPKVSFGSGLGLYMMKKSAQIINAEISYTPLDKGSLFTLKLPLN